MRHLLVRRAMLALAAVLAGAAALFAWAAGRTATAAGGEAGGEAAFEARCADCHEAADLAVSLGAAADPSAAAASMRAFVLRHGAAGPVGEDEARAIVEFLARAERR